MNALAIETRNNWTMITELINEYTNETLLR